MKLTYYHAQADPGITAVISWGEFWALEYFTCLISVTHAA